MLHLLNYFIYLQHYKNKINGKIQFSTFSSNKKEYGNILSLKIKNCIKLLLQKKDLAFMSTILSMCFDCTILY